MLRNNERKVVVFIKSTLVIYCLAKIKNRTCVIVPISF